MSRWNSLLTLLLLFLQFHLGFVRQRRRCSALHGRPVWYLIREWLSSSWWLLSHCRHGDVTVTALCVCVQGYWGCAIGKAKQAAKTEIEKLQVRWVINQDYWILIDCWNLLMQLCVCVYVCVRWRRWHAESSSKRSLKCELTPPHFLNTDVCARTRALCRTWLIHYLSLIVTSQGNREISWSFKLGLEASNLSKISSVWLKWSWSQIRSSLFTWTPNKVMQKIMH